MSSPHQVTRDFEAALCEYTGARYAVTTTSCTQAILMALVWDKLEHGDHAISLPKRTYIGVAGSVLNAGRELQFHDETWAGGYWLRGSIVWDYARRFTSGMYCRGEMQCVSFHSSKILGDSQGGAILLDDPEAAAWLRRARFDGRTEGMNPLIDQVQYPNWHAYLSPDVAARLLWKLSTLPATNADLPLSDYPDLSQQKAFK